MLCGRFKALETSADLLAENAALLAVGAGWFDVCRGTRPLTSAFLISPRHQGQLRTGPQPFCLPLLTQGFNTSGGHQQGRARTELQPLCPLFLASGHALWWDTGRQHRWSSQGSLLAFQPCSCTPAHPSARPSCPWHSQSEGQECFLWRVVYSCWSAASCRPSAPV